MMEAERAYETLECSSILTRLVAREDFIATTILLLLLLIKFPVIIDGQLFSFYCGGTGCLKYLDLRGMR
jgi:hypothetical protein